MAKKKKTPVSYVISVSLKKGCYRHIRISGMDTLEDLAYAILDSVNFECDHLYSFFMDNKAWSVTSEYTSGDPEDDDLMFGAAPRSAAGARLDILGLYEGRKFLFIFDFGDDRRFQCKVLKVLDEETGKPQVVRSKGEAPQQYGEYDDEYYEPTDEGLSGNWTGDHDYSKEYKISKELYDTAFRFYDSKTLHALDENEIFAIELSNGETGYCHADHDRETGGLSFSVCLGDVGAQGLIQLSGGIPFDDMDFLETIMAQRYVQVSFDKEKNMPPFMSKSVRKYAKAAGMELTENKLLPFFLAQKEYHLPWHMTENEDKKLLLEALRTVMDNDSLITDKKRFTFDKDHVYVPTLLRGKNDFEMRHYPLYRVRGLDKTIFNNDIVLYKLKELPKRSKWECELAVMPYPAKEETGRPPFYPYILLCMDLEDKAMLPTAPLEGSDSLCDDILLDFAENAEDCGYLPESIRVSDKKTEALLKDFCGKLGIELKRTKPLKKFTEMKAALFTGLAEGIEQP